MAIVAAVPLLVAMSVAGAGPWVALTGAPALAIAYFAWALSPRAFLVGSGVVAVERRRWRRLELPLSSLRRAVLLPAAGVHGALRVAGSGGAFGNYGLFWSRALGTFRLYATRSDRLVLLDADRERLVVSPDDVEGFLEAVRAHAPRALADTMPDRADRPPRGRARIARALSLALFLPLAAVAVALLAGWARAPASIHVAGDAIRIERNAGGPTLIPLASVRSVEPLPPERLRGISRTHGYALGDVAYGRFRSRTLGPFRLEQHRGRGPWVLVDAGERWVLTPDAPEEFVAAARAAAR
jgi:hypothetical protein